jgi:hypothetical protein
MSKRTDDEYTYLEWITGMRQLVNMYFDKEIIKIAHDDELENPVELISNLNKVIAKFKNQIPDDMFTKE